MANVFWETKTVVCDICKERPMKKTVEINRGEYKGVCDECDPTKEDKMVV